MSGGPGSTADPDGGESDLPDPAELDLPEPARFPRVIGPSVVLLAVSIGSGEFVLWPYVSSRAGLGLLWIALVGLLIQYFVNMEIERYTLATGETAITGFTRSWRPWAWLFVLFTAVPWVWPGWATGAATTAGFVFGWGRDSVVVATVLGLVAIGIALSVSPVVYAVVERFQMIMMGSVAVFLVVALVLATDTQTWTTIVTEVGLRAHPDLTPALLLGMLAFAGGGGTLNLAYANWVRDKGMGMGAHMAPIVSPITGDPRRRPALGHVFRLEEGNLTRWRGWWRVANLEHVVFFVLLGFAFMTGLSVLAAATVFGQEVGSGFDFIRAEGSALGRLIAPWFRNGFWLAGAVLLFTTNLGILDHVGRLIADIVGVNWTRGSRFWNESRLYLVVVWAEIAAGAAILLFAVDGPMALLVIASSLNGIVMLVYTALLIRLNRTALPDPIRLRGLRLAAMGGAVLVFGYLALFLVWTDVVPNVLGVFR